jgi:hypothetical protein
MKRITMKIVNAVIYDTQPLMAREQNTVIRVGSKLQGCSSTKSFTVQTEWSDSMNI